MTAFDTTHLMRSVRPGIVLLLTAIFLLGASATVPGTVAGQESDVSVSADLGSEPSFDGITVVENLGNDDRPLKTVEHNGEEGWSTDSANRAGSFVVAVDPTIETDDATTAAITIRYFDAGTTAVTLLHGDDPRATPVGTFELTNTGEWREHTFYVDDVVVSNDALFGGNDFQLVPDEDVAISRISVETVEAPTPDLEVSQTRLGNVFLEDESIAFDVETAGETLSYTVYDYWGAPVTSGTVEDTDEAIQFSPDVQTPGHYRLVLQAVDGDSVLAERTREFAILREYDFANVEESFYGMNTGFSFGRKAATMDLVQRAGVKTIRDGHDWNDVETERGVYDYPDYYEAYVADARERNIEWLAQSSSGNDLYYDFVDGDDSTAPYTDEGRQAFANFLADLAVHYDAKYIQTWNEYNYEGFAAGPAGGDPEAYAELMSYVYPAIKDANPDTTVVGISGGQRAFGSGYVEEVFEAGGAEHMDGFSWHPYRKAHTPEDDGQFGIGSLREEMEAGRKLSAEYNDGEPMPLWLTEFGWPTHVHPEDQGVSDRTQAQYLVRAMAMMRAGGAEKAFYFTFQDPPRHDQNEGAGLIRDSNGDHGVNTPRPSYVSYAVMARQLTDTEFAGSDDLKGAYSYLFEDADGAQPTRLLWTEHGETGVTLQAEGPVTVITIVGERETYTPTGGTVTLTAAEDPVYVSGPVTDVSAGSPVTLDAPDRAVGETIPVTAEVTDSAGGDLSVEIAGERHSLEGGSTTVDLPATDRTGTRVVRATLYDGDQPVGALQTDVNVTTDLTASIAPQVDLEGDRPGVLSVAIRSQTSTRSYEVESIEWTVADRDGTESIGRTLDPGATEHVTFPVHDLADWNVYDGKRRASVTVSFADRESLTVETSVAFDPIVRASPTVDGDLSEYDDVPTISLDEQGTPKLSGHEGASDLGGDVWITWDDEHLYLAAEVSDDVHNQTNTGGSIWQGDSIQLGVTSLEDTSYRLFNIAHTHNGPQVFGVTQPTKSDTRFVEAATLAGGRDDEAGVTRYEVAIPWSELPVSADAESFRLSLLVNDNDGDGRKGYLEWGSGMGSGNDPERFRVLQRVDSETLPEWSSETATDDAGTDGGGNRADGTGTGASGFGVLVASLALALLAGLARRRR